MSRIRYNRKSKKRSRKYKKRSRKYKKRGGGVNGPLAAAPFLPPNGPVNVPVPGITNQQDQQYYYTQNDRVVPNPESTNKALVMKRGGRKSRRKLKKRKSRKSYKKTHKKRNKKGKKHRRRSKNKRRGRRGGNLSKFVEAIPGGTDLRDVYYRTTNNLADLYSRGTGYGPINDPPNRNYIPDLHIKNVNGDMVPLSQLVGDGSKQASKPQFSVKY
jgi:hypothetical protein